MTVDKSATGSSLAAGAAADEETIATETTSLLNSETSSRTLSDGSASRPQPRRDADADSNAPKQSVGTARAVAIIFSTWVLIFLTASNMSGITMAQSAIAEELQAYEEALWFTSSYLISTSALSPLIGRLATIFSPRVLVLPTGIFFATGGVVTATAPSFGVFILGRVLTGIGGAGISNLAIILVLQLTSKTKRGIFVGLVNAGFTIGLSSGAVVYGALLPAVGWRLLFGIQAPIALAAGLGVFLSLPSSFKSGHKSSEKSIREKLARIDYAGAIALMLTIVLFLVGLSGEIKWVPILLSVAGAVVFVLIEVYVAVDPVIPLSILSSRGVFFSCIAQLLFMASRWTVLFYSPIFFLAVRGYAPAVAGSILIPTNLGFGSGGLIVGWLHVRRNGAFWLPSIIGLALFGTSLFILSVVSAPESSAWLFVLVVFANGLATGASLNYTLAHMLHLSRPEEHFISASLLGTFRGFGGSFGTAIGGGIFYRLLHGGLLEGFSQLDGGLTKERRALVTKLMGSPALVFNGDLGGAEQGVAVEGYANASRGTWAAAAILAIFIVALQAASGWDKPAEKVDEEEEVNERANLLQSEGVVEA
ncbi:Vacuolar basic amino acid transporter 1 like protein [Verticillium longisporum]|uniref:Vacuolar basic amino acid transporter 1 like protein n=1 Tax=Verticillium longisporum TaxID=100787 RepID=A0A8I2Z6F2_VERLO|nr:Palmitoyltransferase PFA4 [Verticillium dahliae VDG1]KAG7118891.1 Vacuolar basic amino acid transporter 1 like protein [Verticillium longisporum]PNH38801.1 hypothetical protein VD0004_g8042 [Verticillium dahliae]PNH67068.1 hypothetical protein VD0001_g7942 [Verticillium dahliae]RBQ83110.1 hypothetical protein VDGD_00071 [Verticillium dahliae]